MTSTRQQSSYILDFIDWRDRGFLHARLVGRGGRGASFLQASYRWSYQGSTFSQGFFQLRYLEALGVAGFFQRRYLRQGVLEGDNLRCLQSSVFRTQSFVSRTQGLDGVGLSSKIKIRVSYSYS
jgi:hypothetical protein